MSVITSPRLGQLHADAFALGVLAAHDGLGVDGVQQMEGDLVAFALAQVLAGDDGHVLRGLLAQRRDSAVLALGHLAREAVEGAVARHVRGEQAGGLLHHVGRVAIGGGGFRCGHGDLR
jgi:hypothetical protein